MSKLVLHGGEKIRKNPFPEWPVSDNREEKALLEVLHSRKWWFGEKVKQFEEEYARFQGAKYGISCTSGTSALIIALRALGIGFGDEVITTPWTFIATTTAIIMAGGIPVYIDIDPTTHNIDVEKIEAAITPKTKAVLLVHMGGFPVDMDRLLDIARRCNLIVIEDAAHSWGGKWEGKGLGTIGNAGTFSFQFSKNITAAEGGIVLTNDEEISVRAWSFMNCGRWPGKPWYYMENISPNQRMTEFQAALLIVQLSRLEEQIERRANAARFLRNRMAGMPGIRMLAHEDKRSTRRSYHYFTFLYIEEEWDSVPKDCFIEAMNAEGIGVIAGYPFPLYREPALLKRENLPPGNYPDYGSLNLPGAEQASKEAVWIPQNLLLAEEEDLADIVHAIEKIYENRNELL